MIRGRAIDLANEAIEALEETSSRIELSAALMAKGYAQTLLGLSDDANLAVTRAIAVEEEEAILERADLADSFLGPDGAWELLDSLEDSAALNSNARLLFGIQRAWFFARRGRYVEATASVADLASQPDGTLPGN